jgi:hypothetical protein
MMLVENPDLTANDMVLAKEMAETLHAAYPGHMWGVHVQGTQGVADIRNLALSGDWGFRIKLPAIYSASEFKRKVLLGGGELLERYRVSRGRVDHDQIDALPTDISGRIIVDKSK